MDSIYLGRMVAVGMTPSGKLSVMYRVSSRSFPNRQAKVNDQKVSIVPKPGHEADIFKNPYISYNCAIIANNAAVLTNGSQTDPIAEKIRSGMNIRDSLIYSLAVMDYEKDAYDTPRIAAVARLGEKTGWLGVIRKNGLDVREFALEPGKCLFVSTYERNRVSAENCCALPAEDAAAACAHILGEGDFAAFLNPVTAVCAVEQNGAFALAAIDK